ncbi:MAG: TonB-dependent receptor plug domain-containing protein, partial [Dysgonamonadaceae bacterium]|nr:TonB-dependent receptor plug domain-containing protein [Dysgonamonadaceae bacterium]
MKIKQIIQQIEQSSGYSFFYSDDYLDLDKIISINFQNESIEAVLNTVFKGTNIHYTIGDNKQILLTSEKKTDQDKAAILATKRYSGTVIDEKGDAVIGASIGIKGTKTGTVTDAGGQFSILAAAGSTLRISYIGFASKEVKLENSLDLQIIINEDDKSLDEVVVVGYGVQNKRDVSTSISQLKADQLVDVPISDFRQAMVGKMPGVQVLQTSGDPEGVLSIRVRGTSSVNAGNEPLYIVDGMPIERGFSNLNNNDIESIEILKDASSAAIYGSRGSNGVVLITTKQGRSEKLVVNYDGYYGIQQVSKKLPMMNAYQFAESARDGHNGAYLDEVPNGSP